MAISSLARNTDASSGSGTTALRGSVLVIDDEPGLRDMLAYELGLEGFEVETADSGPAALKAVARRRFDLAITDLKMPGMDGVAVVTALKDHLPDIEVIVATGYATVETAVACLKAGAYDYVQKPYDVADLRHTLERALQKTRLEGIVTLYNSTRALLSVLQYGQLHRTTPALARTLLTADAVALVTEEVDGVQCSTSPDLASEDVALVKWLARHAVASGRELLVTGGNWQTVADDAPRSDDYRSALVFPLQGRAFGCGALVALRAGASPGYSLREARLGSVFVLQLTLALDNASLFTQLQQQVITDELTGLYSRRYLMEQLRQQVQLGIRARTPVSCLVVDVDHFKRINDTLGHATGDAVLRRVADSMKSAVRRSDITARFGGEEFVILLPGARGDEARMVAERVREAIATEPAEPRVTASVGIASFEPAEGQRVTDAGTESITSTLLERADAALYRAKAGGRNRCEAAV